ncbi:uncharacterized protein LOC112552460 [Pogonomyrmex barbatus]|uniref:Uncharacterized protein LOC112552460 n=1 Tax=Pogonomyrmex barbatus TaxID=144034 RepID=A0A8N1S5X7_9HYME|nr:uncharacterized protein LOC112552460 [Pogonomyrmex barbatus]
MLHVAYPFNAGISSRFEGLRVVASIPDFCEANWSQWSSRLMSRWDKQKRSNHHVERARGIAPLRRKKPRSRFDRVTLACRQPDKARAWTLGFRLSIGEASHQEREFKDLLHSTFLTHHV